MKSKSKLWKKIKDLNPDFSREEAERLTPEELLEILKTLQEDENEIK